MSKRVKLQKDEVEADSESQLSLYDALKEVRPGLSSSDLIPVFGCFVFIGGRVQAFNDIVGLTHPVDVGFEGGVRGELFLKWLDTVRSASKIVFDLDGSVLAVKSGRSKLTTELLGLDSNLFVRPDLSEAVRIKASEALHFGVELLLPYMSQDNSHPFAMGITLHVKNGRASLYSMTNLALAWSSFKCNASDEVLSVILPPRFCELLVEKSSRNDLDGLYVTDEWVVAKFAGGLELYSRLLPEVDVKKYRQVIKARETDIKPEAMMKAGRFKSALGKACVVCTGSEQSPPTLIRVLKSDGAKIVKMATQGTLGSVTESFRCGEANPALVKASFYPLLLSRLFDKVDSFGFSSKVMVLKGQDGMFEGCVALSPSE